MERLCMGCMKMYDDQLSVCPHCGYAFDTPPQQSYHLTPGSLLEQRYIVGRVLGFGGFGVTYVGWDYVMDRKVAIKEYLPGEFATRMPNQQKVTVYSGDREEQFREGLQKTVDEARRLAKFETVPGIVQIYDCFEANGTSYIVMEFLEGMSLKEYLKKHGKMPVEQAISVVEQVAIAMEAVHKEGILHRDIAPDNIYVLNPDEPEKLRVKLLDFGAARYATTKHSKSLSVIIKPGYAPEEQYRSRGDQGTWTDVYALAATLYKMLTGVTPEDAMERSVKDEVKRPSRLGVKISKPVETALMNALNVKIQDRTQTMQDFSQELLAAEVKERRVTKTRKDVGALPGWVFIVAAVGVIAAGVVGVRIATGISRANWGSNSLEENMVRVPNVTNHEVTEAETLLEESELEMNRDRAVYSDEVPADMVSYQEQKENSQVEKHSTVVVWVSLGEKTGVIPSVIGQQREDAESLLKEAGFEQIEFVESQEEGAYNSVLAISEEPGTSVGLKHTITVTVCMNEASMEGDSSFRAEVPDLSVLLSEGSREDVEAALKELGLKANWIEEYSDTVEEGGLIAQSPEAGEMANRDSYVEIRISLGREKINIELENVLYRPQAEAESALEEQKLSVAGTVREYSDSVAKGSVIRVTGPDGGEVRNQAALEEGTALTLVISNGRKPSEQTQTQAPAQTETPRQTQAPAPETPAPTQPQTEAPVPETPAPTQPQTEAPVPATDSGTPDINF